MGRQGDLVRGMAALALAATLAAAQPPEGEEGPVKFGPVPTFPPEDEPYVPREVLRNMERPHLLLGILLAALVVLIASGAKTGGGAVLDAVYILVLKLGPDVRDSGALLHGRDNVLIVVLWTDRLGGHSASEHYHFRGRWDCYLAMLVACNT